MNMRAFTSKDRTDMPTGVLRWEDPPVLTRGHKVCWFDSSMDALKANPGKWGQVRIAANAKAATTLACSARNRLKRWKVRGFEITSRRLKDGRGAVYARYVGHGRE